MKPSPSEKIVPDYEKPATHGKPPVSYLAVFSAVVPLFYTMIARGFLDPRMHEFDDALGFSPRGMLLTKLAMFPAIPFLGLVVALWSIQCICKHPPLTGIHIAVIAILLNVAMAAYESYEIYNLYRGYL
jgi:hypothetical protein